MNTYVVEIDDTHPTVTTGATPLAVTVLVRVGTATVRTGTVALAAGKGVFHILAGESWEWSTEATNVEQATVTISPGGAGVVMWQTVTVNCYPRMLNS